MKVTIVFEFPEINNPDGPEADEVIEALTEATKEWSENFNAVVYVDDATGKVG